MKTLHLCFSVVILFLSIEVSAQYKIEVLDSNTFHLGEGVILSKTSFRGLSVVDDNIIWISGSRGTIAKSIDGGKSFSFQQLKGYEKSDFRDIEAFDDKHAIIMSSGTPAYILKTIDGGKSWKEVYKNTDTAYFLDAMDFWNDKKGILVGDPINGHFLLLQTNDGGETWKQLDTSKTPNAFPGETVFAASGTSLRCIHLKDTSDYEFAFVTGGKSSRLIEFISEDDLKFYEKTSLPIGSGTNSSGAFSFDLEYQNGKYLIVTGGDYLFPDSFNNNFYSAKFGTTSSYSDEPRWMVKEFLKEESVKGYRSCLEKLNNDGIITCGINGVDFGFYKFRRISKQSFNVVRKAKKGKAVFLAGGKGKIGRLIY